MTEHLSDDDLKALLRGDEPPTEVVQIGSSDVGNLDIADRPVGAPREARCNRGAHFWFGDQPTPEMVCECGEFTYRAFVERAQ